MNIGWAVDILRRAADKCKIREIRRPKLYEALDFLEKSVEPAWLVKRYRRELSGTGATYGKRINFVKRCKSRREGFSRLAFLY